jgi:hypothetical protein
MLAAIYTMGIQASVKYAASSQGTVLMLSSKPNITISNNIGSFGPAVRNTTLVSAPREVTSSPTPYKM